MAVFERVVAPKVTLVDLLDRVLERGLVIDADIIICLAGVPLIGIKLRAALAGMETMVQYGLMRDDMNQSQNTPLWFDKLTTNGANPLALSLSKGGHDAPTTISG